MQNKVLIIAYYWPPAGGPGVQRWLKFVKYLPDYGYHPVVYVPANPNYPLLDNSLAAEIPENITILKRPIKEPYRAARFFSKYSAKNISSGVIPKVSEQSFLQQLMLYIRGNYFIPDGRIGWVKPSVEYLSKYIKKHKISTIITTGPPHSLHLIGLKLKTTLDVKWIADFRDPWTTIGYHKQLKLGERATRIHETMEIDVLQNADHVIVTSENTKREFENKTNQAVSVITNGYDYHQLPKVLKDEHFSIAHIGSLLSERNPIILWKVLGELIEEHHDFKNYFVLHFIGVISDDVLGQIYQFIPKSHVDIVGYVPHNEALLYQRKSQLLLLIEINSEVTKAIIPGKLFEYMVAETPILAIGPEDSDVEQIIKSSNTGCYFNYDAELDLKDYIWSSYLKFRDGNLTSHPIGLQQYSRKMLTKKLADIIAGLL